ncbi:LysR family transcriptional regulator [Pseudomonas sp. ME-P-057]|uniref:LysR family transcriptional regulator n=1 Tax=Pseudomonas sp. ME-P-057 TaxID=3040321 RepID=UPI002555B386|nr:LysR family transcriptional regulator [Pseudomonas sp. ME-P-057]
MPSVEQALSGVVIFVTAARAGSFTLAADRLGITKSAVGKSIAKLEDRLGCKLFHRSTRRLALTVDGEAYFASCSLAVDEILAAEAFLTSNQKTPGGRLRIDLPAAYGRSVVLPVLLDILAAYPELKLTVTFSDSVVDLIEEGIDLSIRFGTLKDSSGLVARRLAVQKQIICAAPSYIEKYGHPKSLEELQQHRCIVNYRRGQRVSWTVLDEAGVLTRITPPGTHEVGDGDAIIAMAAAGQGICQMPGSLIRDHLNAGRLVPVLENYSQGDVAIHAVWPQTRHLQPKVRRVVDELVARAEKGDLS